MRKISKRAQEENRAGWLFMTPAMIIFVILVAVPVVVSLLLSFTKWNFLSGLSGIEIGRASCRERVYVLV